MRARTLTTTVLVLLPGVAAACPSCLSSAYGDRTFNWAFLGLILMPFVVAGAIGGVLLYTYRSARARRVAPRHSGSPRAGGPEPADALRLTRPDSGSPRVGGPEPADTLRLTRPPLEETT